MKKLIYLTTAIICFAFQTQARPIKVTIYDGLWGSWTGPCTPGSFYCWDISHKTNQNGTIDVNQETKKVILTFNEEMCGDFLQNLLINEKEIFFIGEVVLKDELVFESCGESFGISLSKGKYKYVKENGFIIVTCDYIIHR
jgi:hypothetical protein